MILGRFRKDSGLFYLPKYHRHPEFILGSDIKCAGILKPRRQASGQEVQDD